MTISHIISISEQTMHKIWTAFVRGRKISCFNKFSHTCYQTSPNKHKARKSQKYIFRPQKCYHCYTEFNVKKWEKPSDHLTSILPSRIDLVFWPNNFTFFIRTCVVVIVDSCTTWMLHSARNVCWYIAVTQWR